MTKNTTNNPYENPNKDGKIIIQIPFNSVRVGLPTKYKDVKYKKNESLTDADMEEIKILSKNHSVPLLAYMKKTSQGHIRKIIDGK